MNIKKYIGLTGSQLKWIAIITMLFDHAAKIITFNLTVTPATPFSVETIMDYYSKYEAVVSVMLFLGRLAFPIFCFLLVEGFLHTSSLKRYGLQLLLFALISEIPYDLAFNDSLLEFSSQNVFFTLFIGLATITALQKISEMELSRVKLILSSIFIVLAGILIAELLHTDYRGRIGVLMIVVLYLFKDFPLVKCGLGALVILQNSKVGPLSFILIYLYNGRRGRQPWKYFFYVFYPAHLLLLVAIQNYAVIPYLRQFFEVVP